MHHMGERKSDQKNLLNYSIFDNLIQSGIRHLLLYAGRCYLFSPLQIY